MLEFLQLKHQYYKIADPCSDKSLKASMNVKYRFTKYNSHTEVNTVRLYCF